MITKEGNVLNVKSGIIAHGCNAQGVMGSGVAKALKDKWPDVYQLYRQAYDNVGELVLGSVQFVKVDENLIVANCITQQYYGRDSDTRYVSYDAVDECFALLASKNLPVHFPLIGGGLGNGDSNVLKAIFEKHLPEDRGTLWLYRGD